MLLVEDTSSFWQGCNKGNAGIGVFIGKRWIDRVVDVVSQ